MNSKPRIHRAVCPTCKAAVETADLAGDPHFPFCSRRCKLIDLGRWFEGDYRISEPAGPTAGENEGGTR